MIRSATVLRAAVAALPFCLFANAAAAITPTLPAGATNMTVLASVDIGPCAFHAGTAQVPATGPAKYVVFVQRVALNAACTGAFGYEVLGGPSYAAPHVAIAAGANGQLAVAYDGRSAPSPASPVSVSIVRLDPASLSTVATSGLAVPPPSVVPGNPPQPSILVSGAAFTVPGDLLVFGTKTGKLPPAIEVTTAGGANYQAKLARFAVETGAPAVTQVLSW
jgi:hypothetical protein